MITVVSVFLRPFAEHTKSRFSLRQTQLFQVDRKQSELRYAEERVLFICRR